MRLLLAGPSSHSADCPDNLVCNGALSAPQRGEGESLPPPPFRSRCCSAIVYTPRLSIHFIRNVFAITLQRRGHRLSNGERAASEVENSRQRSREALFSGPTPARLWPGSGATLALVRGIVMRCVCSISGHQPT